MGLDETASNLTKHGVSFFEAATVFADPSAVYLDDGSGVGVLVVIGASLRERVLYVVHVQRASAIESSVHALQNEVSGPSMKAESHESSDQAAS